MEIITRQLRPAPASQLHESARLSLPSRRRCVCSPVCAFGKRVNQTQGVKTVPVTQDKPAGSVPMALKIGAVLVLVAAAVKIVNKIRNQGSRNELEDRGFIAEGGQTTSGTDPFYNNVMKKYNTIQYQELSSDQIEAARKRRSQDRRNDENIDLSKIQLPANHPFAVSKQISDEEEKLQLARLNVRRGLPIKDQRDLKSNGSTGSERLGGMQQRQQPPPDLDRRDAAMQRRARGQK